LGGMGGSFSNNDPTVVAAFHRALLQGGIVVLALLTALFVVWRISRSLQLRAVSGDPNEDQSEDRPGAGGVAFEPAARRFLRVAFGLLWIFDGLLQQQASMPLGMIPQVVQPAAATSPGWVRHLVEGASSVWTYHPVTAAAAAVWIQIGIGFFLLVASRGNWSRLAGVASAGWGVVVWIFGEAFGGIFGTGLTWLFGAPGAALFYVLAGVLVALPVAVWSSPALGRWSLRAMGGFFAGMALLQAWPGRGYWQGQAGGAPAPGTLTGMVQQMAGTSQPHLLASVVNWFARFDAAHGWGVNLFAVVALAAIGAAFLSGRPRAARLGLSAAVVIGLADWLLIEDLGFMGGTGTDPNSMIPMLLILAGGYLALTRLPVPVTVEAMPSPALPWRQRLRAEPAFALRISAALAGVGITLVGAAPMAVAATQSGADPILADAIAGPVNYVDYPAPPFHLTDQRGQPVSLSDLRGSAAIVTFLDPVCTTDCPVIGSELRQTDAVLGSNASRVKLVAINANSVYTSVPYLQAFDHQDQLENLANWSYLTGPTPQLQAIWRAFGVDIEPGVGGAMMSHSDVVFVIDPSGHTREIINSDPGPSTAATSSSFAQIFALALTQVLHE
jgi:cytochrome oxidase Cu insertion factor (SCO1/SenC/PrrC family)